MIRRRKFNAPTVRYVKKRVTVAYAHNSGAWKIAYADFVTAMMAFFLLLWLYSMTTPVQKKALADYFTPTYGLRDNLGVGFGGGKRAVNDGDQRLERSKPMLVAGEITQGPDMAAPDQSLPKKAAEDADGSSQSGKSGKKGKDMRAGEEFMGRDEDLKQSLQAMDDVGKYPHNIVIKDTPEGVEIEMTDNDRMPMFKSGTATLTDTGKKVLTSMAGMTRRVPNALAITGYASAAVATADARYTNWELSTDRANVVRRYLVKAGLNPARVMRVIGIVTRPQGKDEDKRASRQLKVTMTLLRGTQIARRYPVPLTSAPLVTGEGGIP